MEYIARSRAPSSYVQSIKRGFAISIHKFFNSQTAAWLIVLNGVWQIFRHIQLKSALQLLDQENKFPSENKKSKEEKIYKTHKITLQSCPSQSLDFLACKLQSNQSHSSTCECGSACALCNVWCVMKWMREQLI